MPSDENETEQERTQLTQGSNNGTDEENVGNGRRDYATDIIGRHVGKGNNIKLVLRWYG